MNTQRYEHAIYVFGNYAMMIVAKTYQRGHTFTKETRDICIHFINKFCAKIDSLECHLESQVPFLNKKKKKRNNKNTMIEHNIYLGKTKSFYGMPYLQIFESNFGTI
jgi:hypothetical protein